MPSFLTLVILATSLSVLWTDRTTAQAVFPDRLEETQLLSDAVVSETIILDTDDQWIVEENYKAATAIEANQAAKQRGVRLSVGASVVADQITVHLQNVSGRVRFVTTTGELVEGIHLKRSEGSPKSSP